MTYNASGNLSDEDIQHFIGIPGWPARMAREIYARRAADQQAKPPAPKHVSLGYRDGSPTCDCGWTVQPPYPDARSDFNAFAEHVLAMRGPTSAPTLTRKQVVALMLAYHRQPGAVISDTLYPYIEDMAAALRSIGISIADEDGERKSLDWQSIEGQP